MGRALCLKELGRYEKAGQELQTLMVKLSREDSLYAQAGYEQILLSYQSGKKELAAQQIRELQESVRPGAVPQAVREKLKSLQTAVALEIAEKKTAARGGESGKDTVRELKKIAADDVARRIEQGANQ